MKSAEQIRAELNDALTTVREYRSGDLYSAFVKLLDAIDEHHRERMLTTGMENIQHRQGAAAQVRALRNALVSTGPHASPIG